MLASAEQVLGGALSRLMVVSEQYPDLKANQTMMHLSEEPTTTENKVAFARQAYNDGVMGYNNAREVFPNNFVASAFEFQAMKPLEIESASMREVPKISFS